MNAASYGWLVSIGMALISLILIVVGAFGLSPHAPPWLRASHVAVGLVGLVMAFRVFRKWRTFQATGTFPDNRRAALIVWTAVATISIALGILSLLLGLLSGRFTLAFTGGCLTVFGVFTFWFGRRRFR